MNTINQILPFYDVVTKQDVQRFNSKHLRVSPITQCIPFQIKRAHSSDPPIVSLKTVDCLGVEAEIIDRFVTGSNLISSWSAPGGGNDYDSYGSSGDDITTTYDTTTGGRLLSNAVAITSGNLYLVTCVLTLNSGQAPSMKIGNASFTGKSNTRVLVAGANILTFKATETNNLNFWVYNNSATNFSIVFTIHKLSTIIQYNYTSVDYFQYNGAALTSALTEGNYYLKATDGVTTWYSEPFSAKDTSALCKLTFTHSCDIGDILYAHAFVQSMWFDSQLYIYEPKKVVQGEDHDGVLIIEKVVMLHKLGIVEWIAPSLIGILSMIEGHGTITFTDELGTSYTPDNIDIKLDGPTLDFYRLELTFTDNEVINTLNQTAIA